jgi:Rrf2 family transcriptional regulator, iron-sulfur cluster assembly transcription factor
MKLSAECHYAIEALAYMSLNKLKQPIKLSEIAQAQNLPLPYLEKIFIKLRTHNIVTSIKGPGGGFKLNMSKEKINLALVINALDSNLQAMRCAGASTCSNGSSCLSHSVWDNLNQWVHLYFSSVNLANLHNQDYKNILQLR